jgi:hypothetical protein
MNSRLKLGVFACEVILKASTALAGIINVSDVVGTETLVASGNGLLDLRMMTFSGSEVDNASGSFNGDNANPTLTQGGGADTGFFIESYVTSALELKDFYRLTFPDGMGGSLVNEIVIFIDLNETGNGEPINNLDKVELVLNPVSIAGAPNPFLDVSGAEQAAIDQSYTGGSVIANLASTPVVIPVNAQGAGHADYAVFTGVDPFTLSDGDSLLFNISMSVLNNGAEEIFLSGEFTRATVVPEPTACWMLLGASVPFAARRRRTLRR